MTLFKKIKLIILFSLIFINFSFSEKFSFKFTEGSKQRIEAIISGKQYQNKQLLVEYVQFFKTIRTIKEVRDNAGIIDDYNYFYNQNKFSSNKVMEIKDTTIVGYLKDKFGNITVFDNAFFPIFRNIPVFTDDDIQPGYKWKAEGKEIQDIFNDKFISIFPLSVNYTFIGYEEINNKKIAKFEYEYSIDIKNTGNNNIDPRISRVIGSSKTTMYFDNELGTQVKEEYTRDYSFLINKSSGKFSVSFVDSGTRLWLPVKLMDKDNIMEDIKNTINEEKIENTKVFKDDRGIKIQMEDLKFYAESTELLIEEKTRLEKVANILTNYKDRGTLIIGHTALAGTKEGRLKLSIDRAKAIADYLIKQNAIDPSKSSILGKGAEEPIADNSTEEGKKKNRRVEIFILEE